MKKFYLSTKSNGFTLAEVLITLGIIGVVSAMTLPTLISNYQSEALTTKKLLFEDRLEEAMNQMRFHEKLNGYADAEEFVDELAKYLKINEVCDLADMQECFPDIVINSCDDEWELSDLQSGNDFASTTDKTDFSSENVGVVFADGTKAIVNYDLNCDWLDPYDGGANRSEAVQCVTLLADVNGNKGKNTVGNDILPINTIMGVSIDGICWSLSDILPSTIDCTDTSGVDYKYCEGNTYFSEDYWAAANKACSEQGESLPTLAELSSLYNYLHDTDVISFDDTSVYSLTVNTDKVAELNFSSRTGSSSTFYQWSSVTTAACHAKLVGWSGNHLGLYINSRNNEYASARCVK
ncbi:MAG: type II secretion system protein [Candidatus Gastranaerophilales bacterium]